MATKSRVAPVFHINMDFEDYIGIGIGEVVSGQGAPGRRTGLSAAGLSFGCFVRVSFTTLALRRRSDKCSVRRTMASLRSRYECG